MAFARQLGPGQLSAVVDGYGGAAGAEPCDAEPPHSSPLQDGLGEEPWFAEPPQSAPLHSGGLPEPDPGVGVAPVHPEPLDQEPVADGYQFGAGVPS